MKKCLLHQNVWSVDLLVRSWVEMICKCKLCHAIWCRPPCEVVSWNVKPDWFGKDIRCRPPCEVVSWNFAHIATCWGGFVDLLVRSWVEIKSFANKTLFIRRPPCEVVSWNSCDTHPLEPLEGRPPCEVVSWNVKIKVSCFTTICRPPCEVVSWNINERLWLITLTGRPPCEVVSWNNLKEY